MVLNGHKCKIFVFNTSKQNEFAHSCSFDKYAFVIKSKFEIPRPAAYKEFEKSKPVNIFSGNWAHPHGNSEWDQQSFTIEQSHCQIVPDSN